MQETLIEKRVPAQDSVMSWQIAVCIANISAKSSCVQNFARLPPHASVLQTLISKTPSLLQTGAFLQILPIEKGSGARRWHAQHFVWQLLPPDYAKEQALPDISFQPTGPQ
jgi:hypothetical protein